MHNLILALMFTSGPPVVGLDQQLPAGFAHLRWADAVRHAGRWVRLRVELESLAEARDGFVIFGCASADHTPRTIWFESGEIGGDDADVKPGGESGCLEVVGRLAVVQHPGRRVGSTSLAGHSEIRLIDARLVK